MFGKIEKIPKIGDIPRTRKALKENIPTRPRTGLGTEEDKLEKAALQGVPGTLPERIVWKWLLDNDYIFTCQHSESGGNLVLGGAVVDFVVYNITGKPTVLRVQGDYWHGPEFPARQTRDDEQFYRLVAMGYIVADLWEHDIYDAVKHDRLTVYIVGEVLSA